MPLPFSWRVVRYALRWQIEALFLCLLVAIGVVLVFVRRVPLTLLLALKYEHSHLVLRLFRPYRKFTISRGWGSGADSRWNSPIFQGLRGYSIQQDRLVRDVRASTARFARWV